MTEISYIELLRMAHEQLDSQAAMIEVLKNEVDELNSASYELYNIVFNHIDSSIEFSDEIDNSDIEHALNIHNLEQQAKGVNDFKKWVLDTDENTSGLDVRDISLIEFYVEPLIRQAKALKEDNQ
jgi:hypothetical protein